MGGYRNPFGTTVLLGPDVLGGMILLWSGAIVDIPTGYVLCDGNNGTPDLRNRFVIAAGDTYGPDDTGGANSHGHTKGTLSVDGNLSWFIAPEGTEDDNNYAVHTHAHSLSGDVANGANVPVYYALAYIMKT